MRIPSVATLSRITRTPEDAKTVRKLLEEFRDRYPAGLNAKFRRVRPETVMGKVSDIIGGFGYENIPKGHNVRSPEIEYVNMGDTYATTLLYVNGSFSVGCWGDIVERGNYD